MGLFLGLNNCIFGPVRQMQLFSIVLYRLLYEDSEDTCDYRKQSHTFHERSSQDHVSADITSSLWLTGDRFNRTFTDLANAKTCTQCCYACADSATSFSDFAGQHNCVH